MTSYNPLSRFIRPAFAIAAMMAISSVTPAQIHPRGGVAPPADQRSPRIPSGIGRTEACSSYMPPSLLLTTKLPMTSSHAEVENIMTWPRHLLAQLLDKWGFSPLTSPSESERVTYCIGLGTIGLSVYRS